MAFEVNREELAWAAGFWDGEGYTKWGRIKHLPAGRVQLTATVVQTADNVEVLRRFQRATGSCSHLYGPYQYGKSRPHFQIQFTTFETVQALMAMLWPWLGLAKKDQFIQALQTYHTQRPKLPRGPNRRKS